MITVSDKAVGKIRDILGAEQKPDGFIRVGIKGGGCSGFTYILDIEENQAESDQIFDYGGVKVLIDAKSIVYLAGTELDYTDGLNGSGFVFNNPNAQKTCGCGSSFAV
ncbi:MAG: iron-sulfur cluster insertion protein ErpA [Calditrichaeota bacterium]|nr:MAG: iron-sulfur cluster insertion protein ErpA [Calditrichota bacterium]MBL1204246.1 iron-sulfur cluster insertion protein ErpA [Calditrichota bacterium]NOG44076.1 iron-sulfur cluster insertion protein ErpA [Calditrichota bacterium]